MLEIIQHLIVRLGGMEMAYEFFKLHHGVEDRMCEFSRTRAGETIDGHPEHPYDSAERFFLHVCQPLIESDRLAAQAAERKW